MWFNFTWHMIAYKEKLKKASSIKSVFICTQKEVNPQDNVNKSIPLPILKHDKDIITLIDEISSLNLVIQSLAVHLVNQENKIESNIETTD